MSDNLLIRILADGGIIPVVILGAWALLYKVPRGHRYEAYARILMAGLTAYLIAKLLAQIYQPASHRPFELMGVRPGAVYLNNPGFPSDHILFMSVLTLAVWFETHAKKITLIMTLLTVAVAIGRVLALVHTPIDVIGGMAIACIGALWYIQPRLKP
jgi:membrane-associated phospholipid phosphatase